MGQNVKQLRGQRQVVGVVAILVGIVMCGIGAMFFWYVVQRGLTAQSITEAEFIASGISTTIGIGMIGLGLYDGFLSPTTTIGPRHNRSIKTVIWMAIGTLGGFVLYALCSVIEV